jgi:hypothetical protein
MNTGTRIIRTRVAEYRQGRPEAEHPHERHLGGDQRGERYRHHRRCRGDHPTGAGQTERDALVVVGAATAGDQRHFACKVKLFAIAPLVLSAFPRRRPLPRKPSGVTTPSPACLPGENLTCARRLLNNPAWRSAGWSWVLG